MTRQRYFFKYERLHDFCYICGRLGHTIRDCFDRDDLDDDTEEIQSNFGSWLHASPLKNFHANTVSPKYAYTFRKLQFQSD